MMFLSHNYFYFITIALQAICIIHCIRRNNPQTWIWIIIFLPILGCIVYLFTEVINKSSVQRAGSGLGSVFAPTASIRKLEEQLRFSDTFHNRVALADAYLAKGHTDKAIELYESSLTGVFTENEHVLGQLVIAYSQKNRYADIPPIVQKIYRSPQFAHSKVHLLYALALENIGKPELAEKEFKLMNSKFAYFEPRYHYGLFLERAHRKQEARELFTNMVDEFRHLTSREKRASRQWVNLTKEELRKMSTAKIEA